MRAGATGTDPRACPRHTRRGLPPYRHLHQQGSVPFLPHAAIRRGLSPCCQSSTAASKALMFAEKMLPVLRASPTTVTCGIISTNCCTSSLFGRNPHAITTVSAGISKSSPPRQLGVCPLFASCGVAKGSVPLLPSCRQKGVCPLLPTRGKRKRRGKHSLGVESD